MVLVVCESLVSFMAAGVKFERTESMKNISPMKLRRSSSYKTEAGESSRRASTTNPSPAPVRAARRNSFTAQVEGDWIAKGNTRKPIQSWNLAFCWHEINQMKDTGVFSPILRILLNYGQVGTVGAVACAWHAARWHACSVSYK